MDRWREGKTKYSKSEGEEKKKERKKEGRKERKKDRKKENISTPMEERKKNH